MWQSNKYGPEHTAPSGEELRGYLQIEPEQFPVVLQRLRQIGEQRQQQGKSLEFKWLVTTVDPRGDLKSQWRDAGAYGTYTRSPLDARDPRLVIYGDTAQEVHEILQSLVDMGGWDAIEQYRIDAVGKGVRLAIPRRPGIGEFTDAQGKSWRTINYDGTPGYSEDKAAHPDWRENAAGGHTVMLGTKP